MTAHFVRDVGDGSQFFHDRDCNAFANCNRRPAWWVDCLLMDLMLDGDADDDDAYDDGDDDEARSCMQRWKELDSLECTEANHKYLF